MRLVAVDPGKHQSAWAFFEKGELNCAGPDAKELFYTFVPLVIEVPQIYPGMQQKGDQNDLIDVAFAAGKVAAMFEEVQIIRPRIWKGNAPKKIMTERILSKLSNAERRNLGVHAKNHNVVDAVGIGLWRMGRL